MSIVDDLREAEEEMAFMFSQERWEEALISCWKDDRNLASALVVAAGLSRPISGNEEWRRLALRASTLKPAINPMVGLGKPVRAWIAMHCSKAGDCFWDGNFDQGRKKLCSGGVGRVPGSVLRKNIRKDEKYLKGLVTIKARELDKKSDWKVCK